MYNKVVLGPSGDYVQVGNFKVGQKVRFLTVEEMVNQNKYNKEIIGGGVDLYDSEGCHYDSFVSDMYVFQNQTAYIEEIISYEREEIVIVRLSKTNNGDSSSWWTIYTSMLAPVREIEKEGWI